MCMTCHNSRRGERNEIGHRAAGEQEDFVIADPAGFDERQDLPPLGQRRDLYFVVGMAGNVSEWTSTWDAHPADPSQNGQDCDD